MSRFALDERQSGRRTAFGDGGSLSASRAKRSNSVRIPVPEKYTAWISSPNQTKSLSLFASTKSMRSGWPARGRRVHEGNFPREKRLGFVEADHLRKPFGNKVALVEPVRASDHRGSGPFPDAVVVRPWPPKVMLDRTDATSLSAWNAALLKRTGRGNCIRVQGDSGKFLATFGWHMRKRFPVPFRNSVSHFHENICSRVITSSDRWL